MIVVWWWVPLTFSLFFAGFFVGRCWEPFCMWLLDVVFEVPAPKPTVVRSHVRRIEGES